MDGPPPHFFKLRSRLGLRFFPIGASVHNVGVEHGADAVLSDDFVSFFPRAVTTSFDFSLPEKVAVDTYYSLLASEFEQAIALIKKNLKQGQRQVVVGGDHSIALASAAAVLQRHEPQSVGLVLFDSHGDLNSISSSETGNFHGMWLRVIVDAFDNSEINQLVPRKLPLDNLCLVGNMNLDSLERRYVEQSHIFRTNKYSQLKKWVSAFDHLHLSFDIDVFKKSLAPATGTPNPKGFEFDHVFNLLSVFDEVPSFSFDVVEVNPQKSGAAQTIALAQKVVKRLLL